MPSSPSLLGRVECVEDDLPVAHDEQRVLQHPDVFERVAGDRDQVGFLHRFEAACLLLEAEQLAPPMVAAWIAASGVSPASTRYAISPGTRATLRRLDPVSAPVAN